MTALRSSCGLSECSWIDCATHQWGDGRVCDSGWFTMQLANLRARMFVTYATRRGFDREDAADLSQNVFFAQSFSGDEAADAAAGLAWAYVTKVNAAGGSA